MDAFGASSVRKLDRKKQPMKKVTMTVPRAASAEKQSRTNCGQMRRLKAVFSNNGEAAQVLEDVLQNGGISFSPQLSIGPGVSFSFFFSGFLLTFSKHRREKRGSCKIGFDTAENGL